MNVSIPRMIILSLIFILAYSFIVFKLWNEQVRYGETHRKRISRQSIRTIRLPAERGRIISSDSVLIADNSPCNSLVLHPAEARRPGARSNTVKQIMESAQKVAKVLGKECGLSLSDIESHLNKKPALPISIFDDLDLAEITAILEMCPPLEGMEIRIEPRRQYPDGTAAAHIIGYVRREDRADAEDRDDYFYYLPDFVGAMGLEKRFDKNFDLSENTLPGLSGLPGNSIVRVDHLGYVYEEIGETTLPQRGNDIVLTIDWRAQLIASRLLEGKVGALVMLDAENGDVLAMASSPSFDLADFVPKISSEKYSALSNDPLRPLLNRAILGTYMPGSIIKPLIGVSFLESGMSPESIVECDGASEVGNRAIRCWNWKTGGHGPLDLVHAIENSCNAYFIMLGRKEGLDNILKTLKSAGVGSKTNFPLPESKGLIPSRELKLSRLRERWTEFDTALLSIGQGMILVTPLQAALFTAAIANGGSLLEPRIVKELRDGKTLLFKEGAPRVRSAICTNPEDLIAIRKGMFLAVNSEKGTARKAKCDNIVLSGKTGTAEIGSGENKRHNTWFIGFGRHGEKTYAISILVEDGASGGATCAPLAKQFFDQYL